MNPASLVLPVRWLAALLLLGLTSLSLGQAPDAPRKLTAEEKAALLAAAEAMQKGFEAGDADVIIKGTNKAITKVMTQEQFEAITRKALTSLKDFSFESNKHGEPTECYKLKDGELCFLPRESVILFQGHRLSSITYFICVLEGGKWTFLDSASIHKNRELLWQLFPDLTRDVKLPPNANKVLE